MKLILPLVLILGIVGGVYLVQNRVNLFPFAQTKNFQDKITISNLSPTSFTITYFTRYPTYDFIQYGEDTAVKNVALDSRLKNGLNPQLTTHYFHLKNLKPNTNYFFKINSNSTLLPTGGYLTQQTPEPISGRGGVDIFRGTVKRIDNKTPLEAIVFLSSKDGQVLSAPMREDGSWVVGFAGMRKANMSSYLNLSGTDQIKFLAYAGREGFGLFGEYALKRAGIDITVEEAKLPFYKIDVSKPPASGQSTPAQAEENILWITIKDLLKF